MPPLLYNMKKTLSAAVRSRKNRKHGGRADGFQIFSSSYWNFWSCTNPCLSERGLLKSCTGSGRFTGTLSTNPFYCSHFSCISVVAFLATKSPNSLDSN